MTTEGAVLAALAGSLAVTLAVACIRSVFGEQAANCVLLVLLWYVLYKFFARPPKNGRGRRRKR